VLSLQLIFFCCQPPHVTGSPSGFNSPYGFPSGYEPRCPPPPGCEKSFFLRVTRRADVLGNLSGCETTSSPVELFIYSLEASAPFPYLKSVYLISVPGAAWVQGASSPLSDPIRSPSYFFCLGPSFFMFLAQCCQWGFLVLLSHRLCPSPGMTRFRGCPRDLHSPPFFPSHFEPRAPFCFGDALLLCHSPSSLFYSSACLRIQ